MDDLYWYLVQTKPRQELKAAANLEAQGGEVFLPFAPRETIRQGQLKLKDELLFPGYLFLGLPAASSLLSKVRSTYGVNQLVRFGAEPVIVRPQLIADLRSRQQAEQPPLHDKGQAVRLLSGPFKDYEAIFETYESDRRAMLLLTILGQQVELIVALDEIQAA